MSEYTTIVFKWFLHFHEVEPDKNPSQTTSGVELEATKERIIIDAAVRGAKFEFVTLSNRIIDRQMSWARWEITDEWTVKYTKAPSEKGGA